jgi:hypothetical protein
VGGGATPDATSRTTNTSNHHEAGNDDSTAAQGQFAQCDSCGARVLHQSVKLCWNCTRPQLAHADLGLVDDSDTVGGESP